MSAAVVVGLATGCSLKDEEDDLRAWAKSQSLIEEVTSVRASTGSIAYAFNKRGVADVEVPASTTGRDLMTLSAALGKHVGDSAAFKEVRLEVSIGPDLVSLQGEKSKDEAIVAAWGGLRALSGVEKVSLSHGWQANGLTEDARTRAEIDWVAGSDVLDTLPAITATLAQWSPDDVEWWSRVAGASGKGIRAHGNGAAALPADVATLLSPLAAAEDVSIEVGEDRSYRSAAEEPASADPSRDLTIAVPAAADALRAQEALRATGTTPPSGPGGSAADLTLTGLAEIDAPDRAALDALLAAGHRLGYGPAGFVVSIKDATQLGATAALVPPTRNLRVSMGGSGDERSVEAPAAEVVELWQRFEPVWSMSEVGRFRIEPDELRVGIAPLTSGNVAAVATALRSAGWSGAKRVTIAGSVTINKAWIPVEVSFDSTAAGRASAVTLPTPTSTSSSDDKKRNQAVDDTARGIIRDWDATAR